ncbi:polysaccharide deacetylase family protein [Streptomyces sp. DSM 44915]|uniref:Polysaccharide deacetylase family protein n=1 Tax=Streptomyces chisholmiae TaxID=3075540 RepID=A0ABU2JPH6_9ACTN|nr:polysaccharide deacetylase family protein [Streptomyces sp. DSM 44915]MDT0266619.1 polysaccharide deacetylase family protein [Streptomyces sp. DSM 44915]
MPIRPTADTVETPAHQRLYDYSPIVERPPLRWPGGARVACYLALNIEHYRVDRPATSIFPDTARLVPDPLNYGWRDYGPRVGFWRVLESLDRHGVRASVMLNSEAGERYPAIVRAGVERDWAWVAHGRNNSTFQADLAIDEERRYLTEVVADIERTTGRRPRGWLGPALTESFHTPALLAELGLSYVLDWTNDDQPYPLRVPGMLGVPYSVELNDITLFVGGHASGPDFVRVVKDQLARLHAESATSGRVLPLALHPFVIGQAFRARYLDEVLAHLAGHPDVWLTTSDEIAAHYAAQADPAPAPTPVERA